ncbi:hypothetical protein Bhyg_05521 [Pseudolycoriella hygida]|uniref:Uncharacterized protein n=1 Tax=Pseudolycoriella hygida TaxID=35572 RepID=A0A9Q0S224_9DIPT|nr:hypothetical protein Bhyg_05521 [Pseudolycoriella hygida]
MQINIHGREVKELYAAKLKLNKTDTSIVSPIHFNMLTIQNTNSAIWPRQYIYPYINTYHLTILNLIWLSEKQKNLTELGKLNYADFLLVSCNSETSNYYTSTHLLKLKIRIENTVSGKILQFSRNDFMTNQCLRPIRKPARSLHFVVQIMYSKTIFYYAKRLKDVVNHRTEQINKMTLEIITRIRKDKELSFLVKFPKSAYV